MKILFVRVSMEDGRKMLLISGSDEKISQETKKTIQGIKRDTLRELIRDLRHGGILYQNNYNPWKKSLPSVVKLTVVALDTFLKF